MLGLQGYREDEGLQLESDADEQLLLYIPFTQVIKLHSVLIQGPDEEGRSFDTLLLYSFYCFQCRIISG